MTRRLVLDANILIRASLGSRVSQLILNTHRACDLFTPKVCLQDAERHLHHIATRRAFPVEPALHALKATMRCIEVLDSDFLSAHQVLSQRLLRDNDDWPILAAAMALDATIWSEDQDFFGTGVATLVCHNIELWLITPQFGALATDIAGH